MPRNLLLSAFLTLCAVLFSGCGSTPLSTPPPTFPSLTGNWQIQTNSTATGILPQPGLLWTGNLLQTGSEISGTFLFSDVRNPANPCVPFRTLVTFSGTVSSAGSVHLISPLGGGTATIVFPVPTAESPISVATITITGGTCALTVTSSLATLIPDMTGTYTGSVNVTSLATNAVSTGNLTLILAQSSSPNSQGQFPMTGSLTLTPNCSATSSLTGTAGGVGFQVVAPDPSNPASFDLTLVGTTDPAETALPTSIAGSFVTGPCSLNSFQGTLTKQ